MLPVGFKELRPLRPLRQLTVGFKEYENYVCLVADYWDALTERVPVKALSAVDDVPRRNCAVRLP